MSENTAIERFLRYLENSEKTPATLSSYKLDLAAFSKWFAAANHSEMTIDKITPTDLRQYKSYLIDYPYKPKTINRRIGSLRSFINWLWDIGEISTKFPLPKLVKENIPTPQWLEKKEQHAMMRHLERYGNDRDTSIISIFMNTGMRVQEFVDLKWFDVTISDKKGIIMIRHSKANKYREIPLNKDARYAFLNLGYKKSSGEGEYVLQGQRGRVSVRGVQMIIKRRLAYTELEHVSPHTFRHTFCKNLVNAGVGLEKVAILAGHETLETTKIYCHPSMGDLIESVERIGEHE